MTSLSRHFSISQVPMSQIFTVPAPYWPFGMVPSNSAYSIGWSSVCTARRLTSVSSGGPFGTAQETSTPSCSRRKSQCRWEASCSPMTKIGSPSRGWGAASGTGSPVLSLSRMER